MRSLGDSVGLERIGISIMRVAPGKESFAYHLHHTEEEFIYVLSGRCVAEIADEEHEVGPGDFMGFPTPSVGHHLKNPFTEDLVYLSGGERRVSEVADFPRLDKRMVRVGMNVSMYGIEDAGAMAPFPRVGDAPAPTRWVEAKSEGKSEGRLEGFAEGHKLGRTEGLRQSILDLAEALDLDLSAERKAALHGTSDADLTSLRDRLKQERRWP
jgi:uncharacterized cupin superfamily protein